MKSTSEAHANEAQNWLRTVQIDPQDHSVVILGMGTGWHVQALQKNFPELKIFVLEMNSTVRQLGMQWLRQVGLPKIPVFSTVTEAFDHCFDQVLCFRPGWNQMAEKYLQAKERLTQKSALGLLWAVEREPLPTTTAFLRGQADPTQFKLSDLAFKNQGGADPEIKTWRCLLELVQ